MTGEVLLSHDARRRVPIASITKLMTVIVALQHLKLTDVVSRRPARRRSRPGVGLPPRRPGDHRLRPRQGRDDPVGQRRRGRARARNRAELRRLRRADEREGEGARPDRLALRPARRPRRRRPVLERPRRDAARSRGDEDPRRPDSRLAGDRDARRRLRAPHLGRSARRRPGRVRRQDRPHLEGRVEPGRGGARRRHRHLRDDPRQPVAVATQRRPRVAPRLRPRAVPAGERRHRQQALCAGDAAVRPLAAGPEGRRRRSRRSCG